MWPQALGKACRMNTGVGEEEAAGGRSRQIDHWVSEQLSLWEQFEPGVRRDTVRSHSHPHTQRFAGGRERIYHRTTREKPRHVELRNPAEAPRAVSAREARLGLKDQSRSSGNSRPQRKGGVQCPKQANLKTRHLKTRGASRASSRSRPEPTHEQAFGAGT